MKYKYNLGQAHAIDDFDEDSVWFYITMVSPLEELDSVIELEDIMPYVFWWENRGSENNGPDVDCYGLASSSKLNYEKGGWCHSLAHEGLLDEVWVEPLSNPPERHKPVVGEEHRWHAVSHTLGVDFSLKDNGGTLLTTDNSGNVYKGAFDPICAGTDEKWKIHNLTNAFGANQHEDPTADKYYFADKAHGDGQFQTKVTPIGLNDSIMESIKDRPMTWNLWNVVRHYVYIKYFKNRHKALGTDAAAWADVEKYTKKLVKGIYRTFKDNKGSRNTFYDVDKTATNYGEECQVHWTNSFIEVSTILERNAREHSASFVLFTGNIDKLDSDSSEVNNEAEDIKTRYRNDYGMSVNVTPEMAQASLSYKAILNSHNSFRVTTNEGVDADDADDGMRPRKELGGSESPYDERVAEDGSKGVTVFQGFKYGDLPTTYIIGDGVAYAQRQQDVAIAFKDIVDLDQLYPESEYYLNDTMRKWVRKIRGTVLNKQILPVYTSMEGMTQTVHELTVDDMKSITFQVVPSFYWKYEWSYNEFMIHRVGKLASPSKDIEMYDMLGNVWEWVRDDWSDHVSDLNGKVNPMVGGRDDSAEKKVIRGGSFDQLVRKVIASTREGLERDQSKSKNGTQSNVGFRPSLTFTAENEGGSFIPGQSPVDLFFLFDASASQDSQIKQMLKSAQKIVEMFSGSRDDADMCHVGSALFLGNNIRLMCSNQADTLEQHIFSEYERKVEHVQPGRQIGKSNPPTHYKYENIDNYCPWNWTKVPDDKRFKIYGRMKKNGIKSGREDWIQVSNSNSYDNLKKLLSATAVDGSASGLLNKFKNFKQNVWMSGTTDSPAGRDVETPEPEQEPSTNFRSAMKSVSIKNQNGEVKEMTLLAAKASEDETPVFRGDTGGNSGGSHYHPTCFVAGTKVLMSNGSFKNIEDVEIGDLVLSHDVESGKNEEAVVKRTMVHDVDEDIHSIGIESETLEVTAFHKFWIERNSTKDWIEAGKLVVGDRVMFSDGSWHTISSTGVERRATKVYNFEVSGNHNYYVGENSILVHNKGDSGNWTTVYHTVSYVNTTTYWSWSKKLAVHTGVPAWKEVVDASHKDEPDVIDIDDGLGHVTYYKIHFGEVSNPSDYDWYFFNDSIDTSRVRTETHGPWVNPFTNKFDFFTNDISKSGVSSYSWPFQYNPNAKFNSIDLKPEGNDLVQKQKTKFSGVLTNMWAGCEPVCAILSKLLKDGFFCSHPWNMGVGYTFRRNVPKLVFVFANEFDNTYTSRYDYYEGYIFRTPTVVPGISTNILTFYINDGIDNTYKDAIDPYCLKMLSTKDQSGSQVTSEFDHFMSSIGLGSYPSSGDIRTAIQALVVDSNLMAVDTYGYSKPNKASTTWKTGDEVTNNLAVNYSGVGGWMDLDTNTTPFAGMSVT